MESNQRTHKKCEANIPDNPINDENSSCHLCSQRVWLRSELASRSPQLTTGRHIGTYALTTSIAPWVKKALTNYRPTAEVLELVRPFASKLHSLLDGERESSSGLHDLDAIEMSYQHSLEIGAAILLGADTTDNPANLSIQLHTSRAGGDDHLLPWGRLLTGLECDPPIIAEFPLYLLMCQSFTFEPTVNREDYVYAALTGVDWVCTRRPLHSLYFSGCVSYEVQPSNLRFL